MEKLIVILVHLFFLAVAYCSFKCALLRLWIVLTDFNSANLHQCTDGLKDIRAMKLSKENNTQILF